MNQKEFSSVALVIILVVIVAGVAGYFVITQKSTPSTPSNNINNITSQNHPADISQLTEEQVLNGYDLCGNQFKNGAFEFPGGYNAWHEWVLSRYQEGKRFCPLYERFTAGGIVFADFDSDGVMEALVPAKIATESAGGGVLYVFKNDNGTARVIEIITFGAKQNEKIISVSGNTIIVEIEAERGYPAYQETYRFVNGEFVKQ